MNLQMNEVMMLLGEKDLVIYQQNKKIEELNQIILSLQQNSKGGLAKFPAPVKESEDGKLV